MIADGETPVSVGPPAVLPLLKPELLALPLLEPELPLLLSLPLEPELDPELLDDDALDALALVLVSNEPFELPDDDDALLEPVDADLDPLELPSSPALSRHWPLTQLSPVGQFSST